MRRGWKILAGAVVALAVLLAVNTIVVNGETEEAEVTVEGGRILELPGGDLQVLEQGPARPRGAPIVLIHCYTCSLHWWDRLAPLLAERHRVVRIDLLGFGGSQKPSGGYSIGEQGDLVAAALDRLEVEGAVVVGHSTGFDVAVAVAERASQLVDRLVNIGEARDLSRLELPFIARLSYWPVIGEVAWRLAPGAAIESGYESLFAPGFELESGFEDADRVVEDFRAMTNTSFEAVEAEQEDYVAEVPLDDRVRVLAIPLLVIFGTEDQTWDDPAAAAQEFGSVPGARIAEVEGAGHSPNVEKPEETAALIEEFAADAGDATTRPPPGDVGRDRRRTR